MGITVLIEFLNNIHYSAHLPCNISNQCFCSPKKSAAIECELHRSISLMSHITKILLRMLMMRAKKKLKPKKKTEVQCRFVERKEKIHAICILRSFIERRLEMQKGLYICYIDYTKTFDRAQNTSTMDILQELNIDCKDKRIKGSVYWR